MKRLCLYLFFILLSGYTGLFLGRLSQPLRGFGADKQTGAAPAVIHEPVERVKFVPLPMVSVTERERLVYVEEPAPTAQALHSERTTSYEMPIDDDQEVEALVTGTAVRLDVAEQFCALGNVAQHHLLATPGGHLQHLEHACRVLRRINHTSRSVRIVARLQLATIALNGAAGHYVHKLAIALLKRYCDDDGKLEMTDLDTAVLVDIEKGIELLESKIDQGGRGMRHRAYLDPFQKRVQLHTYNVAVQAALTLNCIPYIVG